MLNAFHDVLVRLEKTPGKNDKVDIIETALDVVPEMGRLFELALSPYITFGVAKLPNPYANLAYADPEPDPFDVLDDLADRTLTGNAAQAAIFAVMASFNRNGRRSELEAWVRILLKDLKCGVAIETVNKAKPGTVPVFSCQLAMSEMPNLSMLKFPIFAEPKYDGVRTIAIKRNGVIKLFSRNGKEFENFVVLANALTPMPDGTVLDGEVVSSAGFAALMTRAKAKPGAAADVPVEYRVFDGMHVTNWDNQKCLHDLRSRRETLIGIVGLIGNPLINVSPAVHCGNVEVIEDFYREQLALGLEGIMLKDPKGLYTFKRNKTWLKLKPFDTADLTVVGMVEGTGKYADMMGALICEGEHQGKQIKTEVGSGFTDAQREAIFNNWVDFVGLGSPADFGIAEIRYQEISKAQGSDTYSLRFPTFVRWRDDK